MFDRHEDLKLIRRCKRGEEAAFAELLARYRNAIYGLCFRMTRRSEDARDLAQEVFIKVFSLLDRYDETYAFSSWIFRIATNHCIDHLRRNRLKFLSLDGYTDAEGDEIEMQIPHQGPQPDRVLMNREAMERLEEVVDDLPPHYRAIILLRHDQELAYEEIAQIMDLPLGTVKARIHRARNLVMKMLKERSYDV
ncbi:sigma-70 family RNA polymerase sigma factor [bacterium]|nr:sigma-70 family RNA polymerase sigma factor [bacterium]HPF35944.1 sigma-70 family RNA polymerase sigma factor [Candidatus Krumholzibacteria bacterium]HRX51731.1 sigma-70 family RNA polymerase sigma factor [Candidatus Krumholzibacteria bacterium]